MTILAVWKAQDLRFDYEFEDYFPKSDTDYAYYNQFRNTYGSDNDFVLISIVNNSGIFNLDFLTQVDSLSSHLQKVQFVENVITPTQLGYPVNTPFGMTSVKWLHLSEPERLYSDSLRIYESGELLGNVIAKDGKSLIVVLTTKWGLSKVKSDSVVYSINEVLNGFEFEDVKVAGRIFNQKHFVDKMVGELFLFTLISLFIIVIFLAIAFRSISGILVPLTIVIISVIWLIAFMTSIGKSFDLMSTLLPTILFVVGMSDVVHFLSRYLEELRVNSEKLSAIKTAFTYIGKATLLTSLTTAIGFLTLFTSGIRPVRDFGLFTATGVMLAFVVTFLVLPAILILLPKPKRALVQAEELFWDKIMRSIFLFNSRNSKMVLGISGLVFLVSLYGISRVEVNNFLLEDLSKNDPVRENFDFFESHYSGARPFEVVISKNDSVSLLTLSDIQLLDSVETVLKREFHIQGFVSLVTAVKNLRRANSGGGLDEYKIPQNEQEWTKIKREVEKYNKQGKLKTILAPSQNETRISAQVKDYGGAVFKEKYENVNLELATLFAQNNVTVKYTGMAYLIDKNNETLASTLMWGLVIAFVTVGFIMGGIFKSFKMVVITLIPNVLPLVMVGGVMGYLGIDLKVSTSIIFTIAFGIAVDDTIHYVSKLKMELDKGRTLVYAIKRTTISTGKAIVLTSLILISGFFALIFSDFASTYYIGLLVSLTLVFAVLSDLFLLPVIFLGFVKSGKRI